MQARVGLSVVVCIGCLTALFGSACAAAAPSLRVSLADGARDVPLRGPLEITATGARLERVVLERTDIAAEPLELTPTASGARLDFALEPDAHYRLLASAEPDRATPLPWAESSSKLQVERAFSTVQTPMLVDAGMPFVFTRGRPIELRFTEPLAHARVLHGGGPEGRWMEARIAGDDPRLVRLNLAQPQPGDELVLRLADVVGTNGVAAADETIVVQIPDAVKIVAVNGSAKDAVPIRPEVPVLLELDAPVKSLRYQAGDGILAWRGAPTTDVELPIRMEVGDRQLLTVLDAEAVHGGWLEAPQAFELIGTAPLHLAAFWPENGATAIPPTGDPTFRFSEPIVDRPAAEAAIQFEPAVPGRFDWLAPNRVRFLPSPSFPAETEIVVTVESGPDGVRGASDAYLTEAYTWTFTTGKAKRIEVSLGRQVLTLFENDEPIWRAPVATGVRGAETPFGTYQVQYKMRQARFRGVNPNGSRYDIPDVNWVIAFFGDYTIHGAYWRSNFGTPGSNGCISLTDANARRVWLWADEGTPIVIQR